MTVSNGTLRKAKITSIIVGTLFTVIAGGYSAMAWAQEYHKQFAQHKIVAEQLMETKAEILLSSIRNYEDDLFELEFQINSDAATPLEHAKKTQTQRRLTDLRLKLAALLNQ